MIYQKLQGCPSIYNIPLSIGDSVDNFDTLRLHTIDAECNDLVSYAHLLLRLLLSDGRIAIVLFRVSLLESQLLSRYSMART